MPIRLRSREISRPRAVSELTPFTHTFPFVGLSSMYRNFRIVLFPEPLGPVRKMNSPFFTSNVTPESAMPERGYSFQTSCRRIMLYCASACSRSRIRSSEFSSPMLTRTKPSGIPIFARSSAVICSCEL